MYMYIHVIWSSASYSIHAHLWLHTWVQVKDSRSFWLVEAAGLLDYVIRTCSHVWKQQQCFSVMSEPTHIQSHDNLETCHTCTCIGRCDSLIFVHTCMYSKLDSLCSIIWKKLCNNQLAPAHRLAHVMMMSFQPSLVKSTTTGGAMGWQSRGREAAKPPSLASRSTRESHPTTRMWSWGGKEGRNGKVYMW